jgi:preprotein translocase subunit SecE
MNVKTETGVSALDTVKLLLAVAILVGGIVGYYYYANLSIVVRALMVIGGVVLGIAVAMQTHKGSEFWKFMTGARMELRKVIWPTQQETIQTTIAVIIFVMIMAVFFWGLDMVLLWATSKLTQGV